MGIATTGPKIKLKPGDITIILPKPVNPLIKPAIATMNAAKIKIFISSKINQLILDLSEV